MEKPIRISLKAASEVASRFIGIPFKNYGRDVSSGLDCWGLVIEFFKCFGLSLEDPVSMYDVDWYKKFNWIDKHKHLYFDQSQDFSPLAVAAMAVRSAVPNHLAICIDNEYLLNTDQTVGVHKIRAFAVRPVTSYYLKPRNLVIVP